jgi:hypothetical protein
MRGLCLSLQCPFIGIGVNMLLFWIVFAIVAFIWPIVLIPLAAFVAIEIYSTLMQNIIWKITEVVSVKRQ